MIDLEYWVGKIKDDCPIFCGRAFETIDNDDAALEFYESPLALVYLSSDQSSPSSVVNRVRQQHRYSVVVKTAIRKTTNKTDRLNAENSKLMHTCRTEIMSALLGWTPTGCSKPIEHVSGELTIKGDFLYWLDKFTTDDYLRAL